MTQLQSEEAMRQGAKGSAAQRTMQGLRATQQERAPQIIETAAQRVAPGSVMTSSETATGDVFGEGVRRRAADAEAQVSRLYENYRTLQNANPVTLAPNASDLTLRISAALRDRAISPEIAPSTNAALNVMNQAASGPLDLTQADIFRKQISSAIRSAQSDEDRAAATILRRTYDDWLDAQVDNAAAMASRASLGAPGAASPSVPGSSPRDTMQALREARTAARNRFRMFEANDARDTGGRVIEDIIDGRIEPQQAVDRIMGDTRTFSITGAPVARRVRSVLGEGSQEWQTIQRGMMRRILLGGADQQAGELPEWGTMLSRINRALDGRAQASTNEMLGRQGTAELQGLRDMMESLSVPPEAVNRSRSGWIIGQATRPYRGASAGAAIGGLYDMLGGLGMLPPSPYPGAAAAVGGFGGRAVQETIDYAQALRAARGFRPPLRGLGQGGGPLSAVGSGIAVGR
jgi:hypothetical protein